MKRLLLTFAAFLCLVSCNGQQQQQTAPNNWNEFRIPDICIFAVPPTMELRDKNSMFGQVHDAIKHSPYWEWVCDECDIFNGDYNLAFQPKGINKMDVSRDDPFATYARILVNFKRVTKDDLNEELLTGLSAQDKKEYSAYAEEIIKQKFNCTDQLTPGYMTGKFEWNPVQFTTIDGVLCLVYDFNRPGRNAQTHVRSYEFYKGDYFIEFILSYNQNDAKLYKSDLENFIKYLHFDDIFKQNRYQSHTANKSTTFKSAVHNLQYTYDATMFKQEKINNAPHMLLKLQPQNDDFGGVTLAAFNDLDLTGYSAHHTDVIEYFKEYDNQMKGNQNGGYTTIIESCAKVTIGNNVQALRTKAKTTHNAYNITTYAVIYRFVNGSELQTLNLFLSGEDYARFSELEKTITKGISFIK